MKIPHQKTAWHHRFKIPARESTDTLHVKAMCGWGCHVGCWVSDWICLWICVCQAWQPAVKDIIRWTWFHPRLRLWFLAHKRESMVRENNPWHTLVNTASSFFKRKKSGWKSDEHILVCKARHVVNISCMLDCFIKLRDSAYGTNCHNVHSSVSKVAISYTLTWAFYLTQWDFLSNKHTEDACMADTPRIYSTFAMKQSKFTKTTNLRKSYSQQLSFSTSVFYFILHFMASACHLLH